MMSKSLKSSRAFALVNCVSNDSIWMSGFRFESRTRAASLFGLPTSLVPNVTCRCQIQSQRRAQTARANEQDFGVLQLELPVHADFRHDQVAAVAQNFLVRKGRGWFCCRPRLYCRSHCHSLLLRFQSFRARRSRNAARDGRNDTYRVAVLRWRVFLRQIADVFVIHVHVHEAAQFAFLGKEKLAQLGELLSEMAERFAHCRSLKLRRSALPRIRAKRRRNHHFHGHFVSPLLSGRRARPRRGGEFRCLRVKIPADRHSVAKTSSLAARRSAR